MIKNLRIRDYNFRLIIYLIAITVIGVLVVGSAEEGYQQKQLMGLLLGVFLMVVFSLFDYNLFLKFWWIMYIFNAVLLGLIFIIGEETGGATRWLDFGIRFQPSEITKIILILFFAKFIMKYEEKINSFKVLAIGSLLAALPLVMILLQPDLSTTIVLFLTLAAMLFAGGFSYKYLLSILGIMIPVGVFAFIYVLQPNQLLVQEYQQTRILAWLHPEDYATEEAYQQLNSIMAIGSGQLTGKGLDNNVVTSVKNGNFISEPQTDFIFTIVGEELGFVGACAVILLLMAIAIECIIIAYKAKDTSGRMIAAGMGSLIGFQSMINICVTTGLLPNTGLPLPFVSAGLTSLVSLYIGMGFVLNVRLQSERKYNN